VAANSSLHDSEFFQTWRTAKPDTPNSYSNLACEAVTDASVTIFHHFDHKCLRVSLAWRHLAILNGYWTGANEAPGKAVNMAVSRLSFVLCSVLQFYCSILHDQLFFPSTVLFFRFGFPNFLLFFISSFRYFHTFSSVLSRSLRLGFEVSDIYVAAGTTFV
jgi:hypothetical protein